MSNSIKHPKAWKFFVEHARNMEDEEYDFKYRIPVPDQSGNFIHANCTGELWGKFIIAWNTPTSQAANQLARVKYIAENF